MTLNFRHSILDIGFLTLDIRFLTFNIRNSFFAIRFSILDILNNRFRTFDFLHSTFDIQFLTFDIRFPKFDTQPLIKTFFRFDEGKKVGESIEAREVLECSALLNDGVLEVFNRAASIALEQRPKNKSSCPCSLL